jgi:hypothetical protein
MRKLGTLALGVLLALGLMSPAQAAAIQHHYVAQGDDFVLLAFVSGWTGVPLRGTMSFVPTSNHASVKIADAAAVGTVPVVISSANGARYACVPVGAKTTIGDLVAGSRVWLYVLDAAHRGNCSVGGTTGLLTVG